MAAPRAEDDAEAIAYREMRPAEAPAALALRNGVFPQAPLTLADWERDRMVVSVAVRGDEILGAIPLAPRDLLIAPGRAIRAPFENAVGTREDMRSRGIGSGMIAAARDFLRGRADGLFVYRSAERSAGYRFYAKTGHHDLLYTHSYARDPGGPARPPSAATPFTAAVADAAGDHLLAIFESSYGAFGGFPRRHAGYWRQALASSIFAALPMDLFVVTVGGPEPTGYAIVGARRGDHPDPVVQIMELATAGADLAVAVEVLHAVSGFAAGHERRLTVKLSPEDPFVPAVLACGFVQAPRSTVVLGQLLDVPELFSRYRRGDIRLAGVGLRVWTPAQDHVLVPPSAGLPTLTLEMKEETLHRWLLGRVDLAARLLDGTVSTHGAGSAAVHAVCAAIPRCPWAYHQLDWI